MTTAKHPGGRPPKFKSVEEVESKINAYFTKCELENRPLTVTGLANALDMTRQGLLDYSNKEEFTDTIKKAKSIVQQYAEEKLFDGKNVAGVIFNMKNNWGWVDKQEINSTIDAKVNNPLKDLSTEEIKKLLKDE